MFGKDLRKVWSRYKGVKRTNRHKERKKNSSSFKNSPRLWRVKKERRKFLPKRLMIFSPLFLDLFENFYLYYLPSWFLQLMFIYLLEIFHFPVNIGRSFFDNLWYLLCIALIHILFIARYYLVLYK